MSQHRVVGLLVALLLAITGLQAIAGTGVVRADDAPVPTNPGYNCDADVLFVGLRGSGESSGDSSGLGKTIAKTRDIMKAQLDARGRSLTTVALVDGDYPARPVSDLWDKSAPLSTNADRYFAGVKDGRDALIKFIDGWDADPACAKQRLVLAGYSQGAMVIHGAVNFYDSISSSRRDRIDSIVLVGDPDNAAADGNIKQLFKKFKGVGLHRLLSVPFEVRDFDGMWKGKAFSICRNGDPVCALVDGVTNFDKYKTQGVANHKSYIDLPVYMSQAARETTFRFADYTPQIDNTSLLVNLPLNVPANAQLRASTDKACNITWSLRSPPPIPPGLSLSAEGRITGTPTVKGNFRVPVRAVANCEKRPERAAPISSILIRIAAGAPCDLSNPQPYQKMPYGELHLAPYDKIWVIPQLAGCKSYSVSNAADQNPSYVFNRFTQTPLFDSSGTQTGIRVQGPILRSRSGGVTKIDVVKPDGTFVESAFSVCFAFVPRMPSDFDPCS